MTDLHKAARTVVFTALGTAVAVGALVAVVVDRVWQRCR